jgi:hypothetical protein
VWVEKVDQLTESGGGDRGADGEENAPNIQWEIDGKANRSQWSFVLDMRREITMGGHIHITGTGV